MHPHIPVPLASTIRPSFRNPATPPANSASGNCPPQAGEPTDPSTLNPQHPTGASDEAPPTVADAIRNGARPHVAPRRHHDHWTGFRHRVGRPAPFEKDVVNDMYETIHRYGLSDTSAARNFDVDSFSVDSWKQDDPYLIEFFEIARAKFELDQFHK